MTTAASAGKTADRQEPVLSVALIWSVYRKHWGTVLLTVALATLVAAFVTAGTTRIYQATATIQFDPNPPRPLGKNVEVQELGASNYFSEAKYYETQYAIIRSMHVALAVVNDLNLSRDATFLADKPSTDHLAPRQVDAEAAADLLLERLRVEPVKDSRLANVTFEDADPDRAQRILTALVDTYTQENLDQALVSTGNAVDWLKGQLGTLTTELEASEMSLHDYKLQKNMLSVAFDDQSNMLREEMKQINEILTGVRAKREEISARRAELLKIPDDNPDALAATELLQSPLLQILRQRYAEALRERSALLGSGKGENHPEVVAATARVTATRQALLDEVRNIQKAADGDLAAVNRQEAGLSAMFEQAKKQALALNLQEIEYGRLLRTKDNTEKLYTLVLERTKESELARMLRVNNIRVVDRPLVRREKPVRPRVAVNMAFGVFFGLLLGLGAALIRAMADRTIKTSEDIEQILGVTFLGMLPMSGANTQGPRYGRRRTADTRPLGAPELTIHENPRSGFAEAARALRTNILFSAPDHPYRALLVTSAGPADGKTTVACCLAIAMAQAGQRVALVDCDLRRPRIHRIFRKSSGSGVTTAILDEGTGHDPALPTEVDNLFIVPTGPIPPNPAEIFHSERFKSFLAALVRDFDRVIIDSPPIVAVTDATILSTLVDGTVLVVRSFNTNKDAAAHAVRALHDVGGKTAGAVLNAVDLRRSEYGSYQYYRAGSYYGDPSTDKGPEGARPPADGPSASAE